MTKHIMKWGVIIGAFICLVSFAGYLAFPLNNPATFKLAEYTGYAGILIGMLMLVFALSDYTNYKNQPLNKLSAFGLGAGVTFIAGTVFGVYNVTYANILVPDFLDQYHFFKLQHIGLTVGDEFEVAKASITKEMELLKNPVFAFFAMASAVWIVGLLFSVLLLFFRHGEECFDHSHSFCNMNFDLVSGV